MTMAIPKDLINSLSKDETILFKSEKLINKRTKKIKRIIGILSLIGVMILLYSITLPSFFRHWNKGDLDSLDLLLLLLPLLFLVFFPIIFRGMGSIEKKDQYFLFTDKQLYIYTYAYEGKSQYISKISLPSVIGVIFKERRWDQKGDFGSLEIIQDRSGVDPKDYEISGEELWNPIYKLNNIPNFKAFQKITESILYAYGNIEEKWLTLKNRFNIKIPLELDISKEKYKDVQKRRKRLSYLIIIIPTICTILTILFSILSIGLPNLVEEMDDMDYMYPFIGILMGLIMTPLLGAMIPVGMVYERKKMDQRCSQPNSILSMKNNDIIYSRENIISKIPLNESNTLGYVKILKPANTLIKWEENVDGISVKESYNSDKEIFFGPVDHFSAVFSSLFYQILSWKAEHGLLFTQEQLLLNKIAKSQIQVIKPKKKILYTEAEPAEKEEFVFTPILPSTSILNEFGNYLNPGEKILLVYKPRIRLLKNTITIIVSSVLFILCIYWMYTGISEFGLFSFIAPLLIMIFPMMCCILQLFTLPSKRLQKNSIFIFTTEKLLSKYGKHYCITPYQNIFSVGKSVRFKRNHYEVFINLNKSLESSPFMNKFMLFINNVPKDSQLLDQIRYLKDHLEELNNY